MLRDTKGQLCRVQYTRILNGNSAKCFFDKETSKSFFGFASFIIPVHLSMELRPPGAQTHNQVIVK